mgnify:FL=1
MKKSTKRILGYTITAAAIYYVFKTRMIPIDGSSTTMTLMPQSVPANGQGANDPSLQLYGIGNPPNWY